MVKWRRTWLKKRWEITHKLHTKHVYFIKLAIKIALVKPIGNTLRTHYYWNGFVSENVWWKNYQQPWDDSISSYFLIFWWVSKVKSNMALYWERSYCTNLKQIKNIKHQDTLSVDCRWLFDVHFSHFTRFSVHHNHTSRF